MALIEWNDESFCVGVDTIDLQHKRLVGYINDLADAIETKQIESKITAIYTQLYDYTNYHFDDEVQYFSRLSKPDAELHQLQHKHFIEQLDTITKKQHCDAQIISSELLFFLTDWLIIHIQSEDRKFTPSTLD